MSEVHIFVEPHRDGRSFIVKAEDQYDAWGVIRERFPDAEFNHIPLDDEIPREEGMTEI